MLAFIKSIIPSLITVGGGGYLINRFFVSRANLAALIERVCDVMDELRDDCASYWSVDCDTTDPKEMAHQSVLETKIKAEVLQVNALVGLLADKRRDMPDDVRVLILDLVDNCTGGKFESKDRKADKPRFMRIVTGINSISVELQRLKILTPATMFSGFFEFFDWRDKGQKNRKPWQRDD